VCVEPLVDPPRGRSRCRLRRVSSAVSATDPSRVRAVGRSANGVVWCDPQGGRRPGRLRQAMNFKPGGQFVATDRYRPVADGNGGTLNRAGPTRRRLHWCRSTARGDRSRFSLTVCRSTSRSGSPSVDNAVRIVSVSEPVPLVDYAEIGTT